MKITVLIENDGPARLEHEHGLAIHIAYKGKNYLLDTGASSAFLQNAKQLGIYMEQVDKAILSHGHMDHSGGYENFFQENQKANVYLMSGAKEKYFAKFGPFKKYIGIPEGMVKKFQKRFLFVDEDYQLDDGVWLIHHITGGLGERGKRQKLYCLTNGKYRPDDFNHELSLVFETERGLVILNSCSHGGIENIVNEVRRKFENQKIYAVLGGLHLMGARGAKSLGVSKQEVERLADTLTHQNIQNIYTGHCTGKPAFKILKNRLGERLHSLHTGTIIEV